MVYPQFYIEGHTILDVFYGLGQGICDATNRWGSIGDFNIKPLNHI